MWDISDLLNEYLGDDKKGWWSSLKYSLRNVGVIGSMKLIAESIFDTGWTTEKLQDELVREMVLELSVNDNTVNTIRQENLSNLKRTEKYYNILKTGINAENESEFFEAFY